MQFLENFIPGFKTFWANAIPLLVAVATMFGYGIDPQVLADFGAQIIAALAAINIILRSVTNGPIAEQLARLAFWK